MMIVKVHKYFTKKSVGFRGKKLLFGLKKESHLEFIAGFLEQILKKTFINYTYKLCLMLLN